MDALILAGLNALGWPVERFEQPFWLWLILLWPVLWLLHRHARFVGLRTAQDDLAHLQVQNRYVFRHPLIHLQRPIGSAKAQSKERFSWIKLGLNLLRGVVISALAVALAQPQQLKPSPPKPQEKTVRDVMFVIESSASFLLNDYQIDGEPHTRMNVVRSVLDRFIGGLQGNRFGLIVYAEQAYTLMPLSADGSAARLNLKRLKPYLAGRTDEAMGEALGLALKQAENSMTPQNPAEADTLKRVVVLISDGLAQPSRLALSEAVNYAQMMNVPIYTVGVGASKESDARIYSGLLYQPLEEQSLTEIAQATQGRYYRVGSGEDLQQVLQQIDRTEGVPYEAPPNPPQKVALYPQPLALAVFTLVVYWLLSLLTVFAGKSVNRSVSKPEEKANAV
ncbi:VWA domain-containing protein [Thiomicrorhabdus sp. zzn3]|uniref:vWA domain-containing protein n=1 Tax=Thiomicrorhabdus sp. zzn3 TaxID=3039775 RepID=UPI002436EA15|nr:VWA domain-containing protein [Thiomicrorhabdus sp. zzn3]MDG6778842.1 VWA domain-containing protein [Thiomicrorhabdus sp. zzn3]